MKTTGVLLFGQAFFACACLSAADFAFDTLIAHRGASHDVPENTYPAYKMAVDDGFGFECDIYQSKDGKVFSMHDWTLTRTTGGANTNRCQDVDWAEIAKVNVAGWGKWKGSKWDPTSPVLFEDVLKLARPGRKIFVEVKGGDSAVGWVPEIKRSVSVVPQATPETVLFICFSEATCAELKRQMPEFKVYWLAFPVKYGRPWVAHPRKDGIRPVRVITAEEAIATARACKADGIDVCFNNEDEVDLLTKEYFDKVHAAGLDVAVWTIDRFEKAREAFRRGADFITTNKAKELLETWREKNAAGQAPVPKGPATAKWNREELYRVPRSWSCEAFSSTGREPSPPKDDPQVTYLWLEGVPYLGKPTKFLACYAIPKSTDGKPVPAMVCIHGGYGTAYRTWVELWAKRGYAAIAMDTCGSIPVRVPGTRFDWISSGIGGPRGWGGFKNVHDDIRDQWAYHAVATVVLSHSFLRAQPGVDPDRIGLTGLSWGGFLTCLTAAVDKRFKFAVPIYTCAFYDTCGSADGRRKSIGDEAWARWLDLWDPKNYIPEIEVPVMWLAGTNDSHFPYGSLRKTFPLLKTPLDIVIRPRMVHSHTAGWSPEEIRVYADSFFRGGRKLPKVAAPVEKDGKVSARFETGGDFLVPLSAELHFTTDAGKWESREWRCCPAKIDGSTAVADMPAGVTASFINLVFDGGLVVSSH